MAAAMAMAYLPFVFATVMLLSTGRAYSIALPVNFTVDPTLSNWTWAPPSYDSTSFGYVAVAPSSFQLSGLLYSVVTDCSPDRFNNNVTEMSVTGSELMGYGSALSPRISILSNRVGNLSAFLPTVNFSSGQSFPVEQQFGEFATWWLRPGAVWRNITGFLESSRGFSGGPLSNTDLPAELGAFGSARGFLNTVLSTQVNGSMLKLFINSTFQVDPRQLLITVNASASQLNRVFGKRTARTDVQIIIVANATNPCALYP